MSTAHMIKNFIVYVGRDINTLNMKLCEQCEADVISRAALVDIHAAFVNLVNMLEISAREL